jgi:hypothetical protein
MSTLITKDTIQRVGYTVIDGVKVVQYNAVIDATKPQEMRIITSKLNEEMYKNNRAICRADLATFEDEVYLLQEEYIAKMTPVTEGPAVAE